MKRLFMTFAAMLLVSVGAFAQSNETPLKGDVNEDGVVDVGDINAIIAIIKNCAASETIYYWYVSTIAPTNTTTLPTSDSQCVGNGELGWHKIGNESALNSFIYNFDEDGNGIVLSTTWGSPKDYYFILQVSINVYAADNATNINYNYDILTTPNITGYKVYKFVIPSYQINGTILRK